MNATIITTTGGAQPAQLIVTNRTDQLTTTGQPIDQNPAFVYLAGLAPNSRRTMRQALYSVACIIGRTEPTPASDAEQLATIAALPWGSLRFQHTAAVRSELLTRYAPPTANKTLSALRGVMRAAWRLGQLTGEEYQKAIDLQAVKGGSSDPAGRALSRGEVRAIFNTCANDPTPAGCRDAAIFGLLYGCGVRRAELTAIDLADLTRDDEDSATLTIQHGKGGKRRMIPVNDGALDALDDWLSVRGDEPGPLFCAINRGGRIDRGGRVTPQAIYNMLRTRGEAAGVKNFSPHDLRRTFISDLLDAGADIATVAKLAGHANVTTTARYDRRGERAKRKAVGLLHIPYKRRTLA